MARPLHPPAFTLHPAPWVGNPWGGVHRERSAVCLGGALIVASALLLSSGCAGVSPVQVGQTAGTVAGAAIAPGIGAPLGSLVGLMAGLLVQGQVDKVTEQRERRELGDQLASARPLPSIEAAQPQGPPTRVWVDETIHDGRQIAGHFDVR